MLKFINSILFVVLAILYLEERYKNRKIIKGIVNNTIPYQIKEEDLR